MHVPIYWLVCHLASRAPRLEALHAHVETWLRRHAPPRRRPALLRAVEQLEACFAAPRELPPIRPRSVLGGPVGAEEGAALAQADQVLLLRARPRVAPDTNAASALKAAASAFALASAGVVYDPQRRILLPLDAVRDDLPPTAAGLAEQLGVPSVRLGRGGLITEGLQTFGLPELWLPGVEPFEHAPGSSLLRAVARQLLTRGLRATLIVREGSADVPLEIGLRPGPSASVLEIRPRVPVRAMLPAFLPRTSRARRRPQRPDSSSSQGRPQRPGGPPARGRPQRPGASSRGRPRATARLRRALAHRTVRYRAARAVVRATSRRRPWPPTSI